MSEERVVLSKEFRFKMPRGERIMREVACKHGVKYEDLRSRSHRHFIVPARIEVARELTALGYSRTLIARLMRKNPSSISFYLGLVTRRKPVNTPEAK